MKYWRGYLVAAIFAACTWGFREFAQTHSKLVDMIYPYVTRLIQNFMAAWSGDVTFLVWQAIILALAVAAVASIVLMIIFKWNPIQWFGWILAVASIIVLLHTGIFGMNEFAGPIAEDIRLSQSERTEEQLKAAAIYYRDQANALSGKVSRDGSGNVKLPELSVLNAQAESGFKNLVYENYYSVFAGSTLPVKELGMAEIFTSRGQMGYTAAITGEAAVNMEAPSFVIPFAISREMCYRMCIASERDKHFGAFLACQANDTAEFRYAGFVMAYRYCLNALPDAVASTVASQANAQVRGDMDSWEVFVAPAIKLAEEKAAKEDKKPEDVDGQIAGLLTDWHYQTVVLPSLVEPEVEFDPMDESQVDLTGLPHAPQPTEATEEAA